MKEDIKYYRREEIVGKEIIEAEARKVGTIKDLAFTSNGKVVFVIEKAFKKGIQEAFLPFEKIEKIGDVVLIKSAEDIEFFPVVEKICPNCKSKNAIDAKYCFKCGVTIP
ncbi:MAG: PRC-barrel domain-containing protein [Candidatus Bathyarchaeia archaeon]